MTTGRTENPIDETHSCEVIVTNEQGLHARPADLVAREAQRWESRIEFIGKSQRVDGKSILDLLTLAAEEGTHLVVEATGPDAREALDSCSMIKPLSMRTFQRSSSLDSRSSSKLSISWIVTSSVSWARSGVVPA